ncbi:MAG: phosphoribosyl-ATP diphosphatase [Blautia sp.]|jgi:phosphoribosyl-ATP pyrophosphohydrolase
MMDVIEGLYQVAQERKQEKQEGSYTCYLFEQGLDKILKKCGEECSEVIIAAKNGQNQDTANEICDLLYHLIVMMVEAGISLEEVQGILEQRRQKIGNLKKFHVSDHNT